MSELAPELTRLADELAPVVGIGGLLSVKTQWPYYVPLLSGSDGGLSAKERFLPIPDRGLSPLPEMYGQLEEQLEAIHERVQQRVRLFGHSLGGFMVTKLALDHPDKIETVDCLAGVQDGVEEFTFTGRLLKHLLGNPVHAEDLLRDSDLMIEHRQRIAMEWSARIPLRLTSPTYDDLIPIPQGLGLELPDGQQPERRIIVPRLPGLSFGIREKTQHLENVTELRSFLPASHMDLPLCPPVISSMRQARRDILRHGAELSAMSQTGDALAALPAVA